MIVSGALRRALGVLLVSTALVASGASLEAASAAPAAADHVVAKGKGKGKPKQKLTLSMTTPAPIVNGSTVSFSGTAPGNLNGKTVKLMRRVGAGEWVKVGRARIGGGTFSVAGLATGTEPNAWYASAKLKKGRKGKKRKKTYVSGVVSSAIYSWYPMTMDNNVDSDSFDNGRMDIGSETFLDAVYYSATCSFCGGPTAYDEWNLSYKCLTFSTAYGVGNDSTTGSSGAFSVSVDGITTPLENKGLGPASRATVDVSTRLRIRLTATELSSNTSAYFAFASPQVLCSANPF